MKKKLIIIIAAVVLVLAAIAAAFLFWPKSGIVDNRTVILSDSEIELIHGSTYNLTARLSLGKADFVWTSSDESVITVTQDGMVTAIGVGTANVTASYDKKSADCAVTVILPDYYPVFTQPDQLLQVAVGQSYPIDTAVTFNGETVTPELSYESENTAIATVQADGYVTGVAEGETYIDVTANYEGLLTSMRVKVEVGSDLIIQAESSQIQLDSLPVPSLGLTDAKKLELQVLYEGEDITDSLSFTWNVEDEGIVSYSSSENAMDIAVLKTGATAITATFELEGESYDYRYYVEVVTTKLTLTPEDGYMKADLSGVEGAISALTIDGKSGISYLSGTELSIYKTKLEAGEYPAAVKTSGRTYDFILSVDRETVELRKETKTAENGVFTVDMAYANIDWDQVLEFTVNGRDANDRRQDNILSLKRANTAYGHYTVAIITKGRTDYQFDLFCYTSKLDSSSVRSTSDFLMFLQGAPQADFTLESDIDFGGAEFHDYIADFSGTLDGQGHVIKNFKIKANTLYSQEGTDRTAVYLFQNVSGTIKNTGFIYELSEIRDCNLSSLIGKNNGTVENCFANMNFTATHKSWDIAPLVNSNQGAGVVRNCITVVTKNTAAVTTTRFGAVVAATIGNSVVKNCYGIYNDVLGAQDRNTPHIVTGIVPTATVENCRNFATGTQLCYSVSGFSEASGWSSYWKHGGDVIFFGNTPVTEVTLKEQTVELTEGFYNVDLSKVTRTMASIDIDGKEYMEYLTDKTLAIPQSALTMGEHAVTVTSTSGVIYRMTLTSLIPGQSLEDYLTLTFREGGTNRLIYINKTTPTLNVDFAISPDLDGIEAGTVLARNVQVYVNGKAQTATITYQKETVGTQKGYIQVAVISPNGWTPTKGDDNFASDPAVTVDLLIPEGIALGDTGKMTTATRYLLYKSEGLDTSTAHPRKTLTAEKANPADYEYSTEVDETEAVGFTGLRWARAIYINETAPQLDLNLFTDLEFTEASGTVVASGVTVYVNGIAYTTEMTYYEEAGTGLGYVQFSMKNLTDWTPVKGTNNYASDPAYTFDVLVPAGVTFNGGQKAEEAARYVITKTAGLDASTAHPRKDCSGEAADPEDYVFAGGEEEEVGDFTGLRWARAIYINETAPQLDLNLFTSLEFTEASDTVVASGVTVYVNGIAYTTDMTYYEEAGTGLGYVQFSMKNLTDWTPVKGTDNYASDPAYTFDVLVPAGVTFNGGQTTETAARYVITKTVGLDASTVHPRKDCTGEEADPDSYVFQGQEEEKTQDFTGLRWARAIYISETTPQLDLNLFTTLEFTEASGTVVASGVTVYVNGVAHTTDMTYYVESNSGLGYVQFSIQNPTDWTPVEGTDNYASDPAYTFDVLVPAGVTFNGGQTTETAARYVITKTVGLDASTVHPRKDCTGEEADPDGYVFASEAQYVNVTGWRYTRAIYINKTTPTLNLEFFVDEALENTTGSTENPYPVATGVTIYINSVEFTADVNYNTGTGVIAINISDPAGWTPVEGTDNFASDPAVNFDVLLPAGMEFLDGHILENSARYVITKPAGLDASTVHPRVNCTAEAADPDEYILPEDVEYFNVTGWRYTRAIYINKTTPTLNLEFFVDAVLENTTGSTETPYPVATGVTIYINSVAYAADVNYNAGTGAIAINISNPAGWTPVQGSDNYASDPAVTFDVLLPAGMRFLDGHVLENSARYIITKPVGLDASTVHPRVNCTAEKADAGAYVLPTAVAAVLTRTVNVLFSGMCSDEL